MRYLVALPGADTAATARVRVSLRVEEDSEGLTLGFAAPHTGKQVIRRPRPAPDATALRSIPVAVIEASSASPRYPASLAIDGDPATFRVSGDGDSRPGDGPTIDRPQWLRIVPAVSRPIREVVVLPRPRYGPKVVSISVDGEAVCEGPMADEALCVPLPSALPARILEVRLAAAFDPSHPDAPRNVQVAEVLLVPTL